MRDLNATMFYKAKFNVTAKSPDEDLLWKLIVNIHDWITRKLNRNDHIHVDPDWKKWTYFKNGGKLYDQEEKNSFFAESVFYNSLTSPEETSWACRIVEKPTPDSGCAPQEWTTEIGYQSSQNGTAVISYVVTYSDAAGFIGPCTEMPSISVPNVIRKLLADPSVECTVGNSILSISPIKVRSGDFPKFQQLLLDPMRELPIIYISPNRDPSNETQGLLLVDPHKAAEAVVGNALVFFSEDLEFSKEMRYLGKPEYNCTGGTIRIYSPKINCSDVSDSYRHRFIRSSEIKEHGEQYVLQILRRALAQDVHFYEQMFRVESCNALIAEDTHRKRINAIQKSSETDVNIAMQEWEKESTERFKVEQDLQARESELEDCKRENYSLRMQLDTFRENYTRLAAIESSVQGIRSIGEYPSSPLSIARYFETLYPERIAFTERGYRSLDECITKPDILWEVLYLIATTLYDLLQENPATAYKQFREITGWTCARGEGPMTRNNSNLMKQYVDEYDGQEIDIEAHIKQGNKDSDPRSVRVHFAYDSSITKKILIGHCGKHLDNYSSQKIK